MADCVIIADDLTGANATGAIIKKNNYTAYTIVNPVGLNLEKYNNCNCILYPTYSRGISKEDAYERVYNASKMFQSNKVKVYSKRIDSTLRGNIGSEVDAFLDSFDDDRIAIVVPSFPDSGRIVCGGYMLVNGIPLHKSEAAIDPISPINTSHVFSIFSKQSHHKIGSLTIEDLRLGVEHIKNRIIEMKTSGISIIIFDGISQNDIEIIADAVIKSKIKYISVDPGPFTTTLIKKIITVHNVKNNSKILAIVGSVNPVTTKQVQAFLNLDGVTNIYVNTKRFIENAKTRQLEIKRVEDEILSTSDNIISIIGDGVYLENKIDLTTYALNNGTNSEKLSDTINKSFAEIVEKILFRDSNYGAIYSSGGDITVAICKQLQATGIKLLDEVLPLAAYGSIIGGTYEGIKIVTKGGMVGKENAMVKCIEFLKKKLVESQKIGGNVLC